MLKNPNFPGLRPQNPLRELTVRAYIAPPDLVAAGGEGTRGPLRNNPTPVLGLSIRPHFYESLGLTIHSLTAARNRLWVVAPSMLTGHQQEPMRQQQ